MVVQYLEHLLLVCQVMVALAKQALSAEHQFFMQAAEEAGLFPQIRLEQEDLEGAAMDLTALMGLMELLILEVAVVVLAI